MVGVVEQPIDFFISRAGADAAFADLIGRILEDADHSVFLQQWDFANRNFMERMHASLESGARVIALLSNEYLNSDHCEAEWLNVIAHDPLNKQARLIVMRVAECAPTGLLTALAYWDLVPIRSDAALLRDVVLAATEPGRHKGEATPGAPYWPAARAVVHRDIKATPSFTGREAELAAIDAALWSGGAAAVTQPAAVHGLGGIGKSVLAREYAYQNRERYAGVWWLNAAKPDPAESFDGIETALVDLGTVFIRDLDHAQDRAAAARKVLEFIAHGGFEKPWLLVYDNVDDTRAMREWAPLGNAQVLATTRIGGWSEDFGVIEIQEWNPQDAIRYLIRESGRKDLTEDDALAIAEELGCLPLALSHAAAYLRARINVTAKKYLDALDRRMSEAPKGTEYPRAVFATLQENADQAEMEAGGAWAVLSLAAFYAPDAIPEELFQQAAECYPPAMAELIADPSAVDNAIGALAHLSLIDFDAALRVFSVHRLAQAAARDALADEAGTWGETALRTMFKKFPQPKESENWPQCQRLAAHARAVTTHASTNDRDLGTLLGHIATHYLQERATLGDVLPLFERYKRVFEHLAEADPHNVELRRDLTVVLANIGDALAAHDKFPEALANYRESLALAERLAKADPDNAQLQRDLSVAHFQIGNVLRQQGNLAEALESYRASVAIIWHLLMIDRGNAVWSRDLAVQLSRIGDALGEQDNLVEALKVYRDSHAIFERLAEADPHNAGWQRDLAISHEKIGHLLKRQRFLLHARKYYRASMVIREHLAMADPGNAVWQRELAISNDLIGETYALQGQTVEAIAAFERALEAYTRLLDRHPDDVQSRACSAFPRLCLGNLKGKDGRKDFESALAILKPLAAANRLDARQRGWIQQIEAQIAEFGE